MTMENIENIIEEISEKKKLIKDVQKCIDNFKFSTLYYCKNYFTVESMIPFSKLMSDLPKHLKNKLLIYAEDLLHEEVVKVIEEKNSLLRKIKVSE